MARGLSLGASMAQRSIYLAGPEVFLPNAAEIGAAKVALCAEFGFVGLYPGEAGEPLPTETAALVAELYARCLRMMARADLIVANLTPFRGPSGDVGTAFELGYMAALRKPCFAYSNVAEDLLARSKRFDPMIVRKGSDWVDGNGLTVEDFGQFDNLMLPGGLAAPAVCRAVPAAERYTNLEAFRACLALARDKP